MSTTRFTLCQDLEEIMKDVFAIADAESLSEVPLEYGVQQLFERIKDGKLNDTVALGYFAGKWTDQDWATIMDELKEAADKAGACCQGGLINVFSGIGKKKDLALSTTFEGVLSIAEAGAIMTKADQTVTVGNFLMALAASSDLDYVTFLADHFDMTAENVKDYFLAGGGKLKAKRVMGKDQSKIDEIIKDSLGIDPNDPDSGSSEFERAGMGGAVSGKKVDPNSKTPFLDQFSYDMTQAALENKYDPVIGRDNELQQVIEILSCRKKNNAVLLGDPGCGKTAIVEALVQKINERNVPREIMDKRICSLDINGLVAGTKFRGEFEERLQGIIQEVCSDPNIIVYIDEFHNLVGAGGSSGQGDGANILKPYLARGEFQCIGSTTSDEYRKFIEKDGALKRRFQNVQVGEPSVSETTEILLTLAGKYASFHCVNYSPDVLSACSEWSGRYIIDRFFPDKAIDIMDMAGALAKLGRPQSIEDLQKLEQELAEARTLSDMAVAECKFDVGETYRLQKEQLEIDIKKLKEKMENEAKDPKNWPDVTIENVASVISKISGVPVDKISASDFKKLRGMKEKLEAKVIGQEAAVKEITVSLQRNHLGLRDENKPIASMLLVGPTGTGKSLLCKEIAAEFFGSEKNLIKFDMAEFSERHNITKLTGATSSYVGYDDAPLLEQVRRNPYSIVLFDEIEKAHPDIYNIFLSILDEGYVTLGNGLRVSFKNTVIVFTGNVGTKELVLRGNGLGFGKSSTMADKNKDIKAVVMKAVEKQFRPEFINRLTGITVFQSLERDSMVKIFDLELAKLAKRLGENGYSISVTPEVRDRIIDGCDPKYGARDLQRGIVRDVENEVCAKMLETGDLEGITNILVAMSSGEIVVTLVKELKMDKTVAVK